MRSPPANSTTIVVIDPSHPEGDAGLAALTDTDVVVAIVVPVYGPCARTLHEFAHAEAIDVGTASSLYLDQIAGCVDASNRRVVLVTVDGVDLVHDLLTFADTVSVSRFIVPASVAGYRGISIDDLVGRSSVPVTIVPVLEHDESGGNEGPYARWWRRAA